MTQPLNLKCHILVSSLCFHQWISLCRYITVLRLNGNPLAEGGIRRLLRGVSVNGSLEVLNLRWGGAS